MGWYVFFAMGEWQLNDDTKERMLGAGGKLNC